MSYDTIQSEIVNTLNDAMDISSLKIINESHMHNVPKESETHFKAVIVSNDFNDLSTLKRHKLVYKILDSIMNKIHALSIHTFNEDEFKQNPLILDSPECANK
jgi:stress-induced morphogen